MHYVYLIIAVVAEVVGTSSLKLAEGFTRPLPSLLVIAGYGLSFYFLAKVLQTFPVGLAYAVWCGLGIILVTLTGVFYFKQSIDLPGILGLVLITAGVMTIGLFSRTTLT